MSQSRRHHGQPWRPGMNRDRFMSPAEQSVVTGKAVKYRGKTRRRQDGVEVISAHSGNVRVSTGINRAR